MIIIIDGPDGTGKTTLAEKFSKSLPNAAVIHWGAPTEDDWYSEYVEPVEAALRHYESIICDRGFFAEPMWARIFGRERSLFEDEAGMEQCFTWYRKHGLFAIVITERSNAGIEETLLARGESPRDVARALESASHYKHMAAAVGELSGGIPVITSDLSTMFTAGA